MKAVQFQAGFANQFVSLGVNLVALRTLGTTIAVFSFPSALHASSLRSDPRFDAAPHTQKAVFAAGER
jgi:hypothetical protein